MNLYSICLQERQKIARQIETMSNKIKVYPPGDLIFFQNCQRKQVYLSDGGKRKYLQKKDYEKNHLLFEKAYLKRKLKFQQMQLESIDAFLKKYKPGMQSPESFLKNNEGFAKEFFPCVNNITSSQEKWFNAVYDSDPSFPEKRIITTKHQEKVRSKSECMIADALYAAGIPYRYECKTLIGTVVMHPDFTILHPQTNELYYWEHFGRAEDEAYAKNIAIKLPTYSNAGIIAGKNLIITTESNACPLDSATVDQVIQHFFA